MNNLLEDEWLIPANMAVYNHAAAFTAHNVITWGLTTRNKVGDIIYIYVAAPSSRITYKCVVEKVDVQRNERLGDEFWVEPFAYDSSRNYINIRLLTKFADDQRLTLHYLINHNLLKAAPQGPRRLDEKLSMFLSDLPRLTS